jgi:hypothetical protein
MEMTVTGWTQTGGPLTGGMTVFDGTTFKIFTSFGLPVFTEFLWQ